MTYAFTLTYDDHLAASRLYRKPAPGSNREGPRTSERLLFLWLLLGAIFAAFVCSIIQGVIYANGNPATAEEMGRWAGAILFPWMGYLFDVQRHLVHDLRHRRPRRTHREPPAACSRWRS